MARRGFGGWLWLAIKVAFWVAATSVVAMFATLMVLMEPALREAEEDRAAAEAEADPSQSARYYCREAVRSVLNDPRSARFDHGPTWEVGRKPDGTWQVRPTGTATNAFGARLLGPAPARPASRGTAESGRTGGSSWSASCRVPTRRATDRWSIMACHARNGLTCNDGLAHNVAMTEFDRYIREHRESGEVWAGRLRCSTSMVSRFRRGVSHPTLRMAAEIERLTRGAVPMQSWCPEVFGVPATAEGAG